ncbi:hypothetical protein P7C73_g6083, partial [Tremellales sp. Uapishka_1]
MIGAPSPLVARGLSRRLRIAVVLSAVFILSYFWHYWYSTQAGVLLPSESEGGVLGDLNGLELPSPVDLDPPVDLDSPADLDLPFESVVDEYERLRLSHLGEYDVGSTTEEIGSAIPLNPDWAAYTARQRTFLADFWEGTAAYPHFRAMLDDMEAHIPPPVSAAPLPPTLFSTAKDAAQDLEEEFVGWKEILSDWKFRVADDALLDLWFAGYAAGGKGRLESSWRRLEKPVFRSDIFRYMALLIEGGIYTDSDTTLLQHPLYWGRDAVSIVEPDLDSVGDAIVQTAKYPAGPPEFPSTEETHYGGIMEPGVSMIISVEFEHQHQNFDEWSHKQGVRDPRSFEICQWTIVAKPFHPIFLDTLTSIFHDIERGNVNATAGASHVTGPGPFTDAVLRYLLVQYGVTPADLRGQWQTLRIGDILLLPANMFANSRLMKHEFLGRWKQGGREDVN